MKKIITCIVLCLCFADVYAQQDAQYTQYMFNGLALNPAYAGASGCTEINFSHLNQWVKVDGAPVTNYFSANTRLGKSFGIGANLLLDKIGIKKAAHSTSGESDGINPIGAAKNIYKVKLNQKIDQINT